MPQQSNKKQSTKRVSSTIVFLLARSLNWTKALIFASIFYCKSLSKMPINFSSIIFFLTLFLFKSLTGQQINNGEFDSNNQKHGYWKEYVNIPHHGGGCGGEAHWLEKTLDCEGTYYHGEPDGTWKFYMHRESDSQMELTFDKGNPIGPFRWYQKNKETIEWVKRDTMWICNLENLNTHENYFMKMWLHNGMKFSRTSDSCFFHCTLLNKAIKNKAPNE